MYNHSIAAASARLGLSLYHYAWNCCHYNTDTEYYLRFSCQYVTI